VVVIVVAVIAVMAPLNTSRRDVKIKTNTNANEERERKRICWQIFDFHSFSFSSYLHASLLLLLHFHRIRQCFSQFSRVFSILWLCMKLWKFYMIICWV